MLKFDLSKCTRCGNCVRACTGYVIVLEDSGPVDKYPDICIDCGHCVAVCPVNAIEHERLDPSNFPVAETAGIMYEAFDQFARNRRSMRRYKQEPVSDADIGKILDSVRYAPTGENAQELEYIIINDPARIAMIRDALGKQYKSLNAVVKGFYAIISLAMGKDQARRYRATLDRYQEVLKAGEDPFLRTAPTLLVIHSKQKTFMAQTDAGIAGYHVMLAAAALGIGSVWNGAHQTYCGLNSAIRNLSLVQKGHKVLASICLGYPTLKYKRNVSRHPVRSRIVGPGQS